MNVCFLSTRQPKKIHPGMKMSSRHILKKMDERKGKDGRAEARKRGRAEKEEKNLVTWCAIFWWQSF